MPKDHLTLYTASYQSAFEVKEARTLTSKHQIGAKMFSWVKRASLLREGLDYAAKKFYEICSLRYDGNISFLTFEKKSNLFYWSSTTELCIGFSKMPTI